MIADPPVVMFTTASQPALIAGKNDQCAGSLDGWPLEGLRACRCKIAAPAFAAPMADAAISAPVIGKWGDMDGVWIDPVMAQDRMIFDMSLRPFTDNLTCTGPNGQCV